MAIQKVVLDKVEYESKVQRRRNEQWSMDGVVMVGASNELAMSRRGK